jgi:hypothetical protein
MLLPNGRLFLAERARKPHVGSTQNSEQAALAGTFARRGRVGHVAAHRKVARVGELIGRAR